MQKELCSYIVEQQRNIHARKMYQMKNNGRSEPKENRGR